MMNTFSASVASILAISMVQLGSGTSSFRSSSYFAWSSDVMTTLILDVSSSSASRAGDFFSWSFGVVFHGDDFCALAHRTYSALESFLRNIQLLVKTSLI